MDTDNEAVWRKLVIFWEAFFQDAQPFSGVLVSAQCFFDKVWEGTRVSTSLYECDVRHLYPLHSTFSYQASRGLAADNCYSRPAVDVQDRHLSARFHTLIPQIVTAYRGAFIDQIRCTHFLGMAGNEAIMLYPSQYRRLRNENVQRIAGEIRSIQTGFGDFRFNAPGPANLLPLLAVYANKVTSLLEEVDEYSMPDLVSFAQYYFALLHPFYERCGRTSEELMYLLFEQAGFGWRYISATGDRSSPLAYERMTLINQGAETFNRKIATHFGLVAEGIHKTPDIYQALTAVYFADQYSRIYATETPRPFYYAHPIPEIMTAYYFLMEALLLDEISHFSLHTPYPHIATLGNHLRETGEPEYQGSMSYPMGENSLLLLLSQLADPPYQSACYV